jgi:hypothetical protein
MDTNPSMLGAEAAYVKNIPETPQTSRIKETATVRPTQTRTAAYSMTDDVVAAVVFVAGKESSFPIRMAVKLTFEPVPAVVMEAILRGDCQYVFMSVASRRETSCALGLGFVNLVLYSLRSKGASLPPT